MTRELHHDVTVTQAPSPDDEGNGMQSILRAFIKNPVAAAEIIGMIGGGYLLYYNMNQGITDAKATSEQHYKDLSAENAHRTEQLLAKLDTLSASDASEIADIKALYARGDQRWAMMSDKLSGIEVRFTKLEDNLTYVIQLQQQQQHLIPHDQRGEIGPRPHIAEDNGR